MFNMDMIILKIIRNLNNLSIRDPGIDYVQVKRVEELE
jgi:hypothetical protein